MVSWVMLLALFTPAQEDLDAELERLAPRLAPGGPAATFALLLKSEAGRLVLKERVLVLSNQQVERYDRDPAAYYERYLFAEDQEGNLRLRPERVAELERLAREVERRKRGFADFDRKGAELAGQVKGEGPLDRRLKAAWENRPFRLVLFQRLGPEVREADREELFNAAFAKGLVRQRDGRLRVRGQYKGELLSEVDEIRGLADSYKACGEWIGQVLPRLEPADRRRAGSAAGRLVVGRVLAEIGAENPVENFLGRFKEESLALLDEIKTTEELAAEIKPLVERTAADIEEVTDGDKKAKAFLKDEACVLLLAGRMVSRSAERKHATAAAIATFRDEHFAADEGSGILSVKKGRFVNEQGEDSLDALNAEIDGMLNEYAAVRAGLDAIAERLIDPALCALFDTPEGSTAFREHQGRVIEDLKEAARDEALRTFVGTYLVREGERYVVRPERVGRVEAMARRAEEIRLELEKAAKEAKP